MSTNSSLATTSETPMLATAKAPTTSQKFCVCSTCQKAKPHKEFSHTQLERLLKPKPNPDGNAGHCKECIFARNIKRRYGITPDLVEEKLAAQGNKCAMGFCKAKLTLGTLHIDHDHFTGQVRGLLCVNCGTSLAGLGDRVDKLLTASLYLARSTALVTDTMHGHIERDMAELTAWVSTLAVCKPAPPDIIGNKKEPSV